jgi:nuclear migration protein JNM1
MEEEQRRVRAALAELKKAVEMVDKSLDENGRVTSENLSGLEVRVEELGKRMEKLGK